MSEKQILVRMPLTTNGLNNVIDPGTGQMVFTESIVPAAARPHFERLNLRLPDNLKYRLSDIIPDKQKRETA